MSGGIAKEDLVDLDIIDAVELKSDGSSTYDYKTGLTVIATTNSTKNVQVVSTANLVYDRDMPLEVGDKVIIASTIPGGAADGTYTVATIVDNENFTVAESIADTTGGVVSFRHPAGAEKVGVDPSNLVLSSATNLQDVLEDLAAGFLGNSLPATQVGQVAFSCDGVTFTAELPITNETTGWIINDEGILIVNG